MATDFKVLHSNIISMKKSMYDKRRNNYPPFSDSLICIISQLRQNEEYNEISKTVKMYCYKFATLHTQLCRFTSFHCYTAKIRNLVHKKVNHT